MPLYKLIFLEECNCMSEEALEVVVEYGEFLFSEEDLYLRMYGGSKYPSLLPKYAIDYVVYKEVVRQLYINEIGNFLFDSKKVVYPPLPFYIGSYKFSKVKSAPKFVKELENFHFGEKSFHRNDAWGKVAKYCASVGVHFEYSHHFDNEEAVYNNACNMTTLNKRFKKNITITGGKGNNSRAFEQ